MHKILVYCPKHYTGLVHVQTVELPLDIWAAVREVLTLKQWAMACGTCHATYALSRRLIAAEVCDGLGYSDGRDLVKQLQLDRWSGCHSLFLQLRHMPEAVKVTSSAAQIEQLVLDGSFSSLQCLHIIGRSRVPLTNGSAEAVFMSHLAQHASVLTLDVKTVSMPLDLPNLQHLILNVSRSAGWEDGDQTHEVLFPAVCRLTGLQTLYVQSSGTTIIGKVDLTACLHLQCVALQGVGLGGGVVLPADCLLHVLHRPQHDEKPMCAFGNVVTGLTMHHSAWRTHGALLSVALNTRKLRRLQLTLYEQCMKPPMGTHWPFTFSGSEMPALKVLELDVQCNVDLWLTSGLALDSLVVITVGALELRTLDCDASKITLKQMFLKSGVTFGQKYKEELETSVCLKDEWPDHLILGHLREEQGGWILQMPASFQPRNLQQCWCGACSDCLVRAGVPILCDQAWTSEGFDKHLRPHCSEIA